MLVFLFATSISISIVHIFAWCASFSWQRHFSSHFFFQTIVGFCGPNNVIENRSMSMHLLETREEGESITKIITHVFIRSFSRITPSHRRNLRSVVGHIEWNVDINISTKVPIFSMSSFIIAFLWPPYVFTFLCEQNDDKKKAKKLGSLRCRGRKFFLFFWIFPNITFRGSHSGLQIASHSGSYMIIKIWEKGAR